MSSYWRTYYHLVWATENRQPLITLELEPHLFAYIKGKADAMGCIVHAIGGIETHIHLVVSILPKLSISDFVKRIKGSSSYHVNRLPKEKRSSDLNQPTTFGWQSSCGVFTLGGKQLDTAIAYALNQKSHHRHGTTIAALERTEEDVDESPA